MTHNRYGGLTGKARELLIRRSPIFVGIMPEGGVDNHPQAMRDLEIAIHHEKRIYIWRPDDRPQADIPAILDRYPLLTVVDGNADDLAEVIKADNEGYNLHVQDGGAY